MAGLRLARSSPAAFARRRIPARPTGAGYVAYETLQTGGLSLRQVLAKVAGGDVVTFPAGVFEFADFNDPAGYYAGIRVPSACGGLWGSGNGTVFRMTANTSTKAADTTAVPADGSGGSNVCKLIEVQHSNTVLKNFQLQGTAQGHPYSGLTPYGSSGAKLTGIVVDGVFFKGAAPGYKNYPPGETFAFGATHVNGLQLLNCELDGRDAVSGNRVCSSQVGINTSATADLQNVYAHHAGFGHGFAFYRTAGIHTVNCRAEFNGGATAGWQYAGVAMNHEECTGTILHESPTLLMDKVGNPGGFHMTINASVADGYADNPNISLTDVTHDAGLDAAGCFSLQIGDTYNGGATPQTSMPTITKGGATLVARDSASASGATPGVNFIRYH